MDANTADIQAVLGGSVRLLLGTIGECDLRPRKEGVYHDFDPILENSADCRSAAPYAVVRIGDGPTKDIRHGGWA